MAKLVRSSLPSLIFVAGAAYPLLQILGLVETNEHGILAF